MMPALASSSLLNRMPIYLIGLFLFLFTGEAKAALNSSKFIEPEVKTFMEGGAKSGDLISVFVSYRSNQGIKKTSANSSARSDIQRRLMAQAAKTEKATFATLNRDSKLKNGQAVELRSVWIANGSLAKLDVSQLKAIAENSNVAGIYLASKPYRLDQPIRRKLGKAAYVNYTYGLKKIGVADVRSARPSLDGTGVRVGVLDTGIDANHPDLRGKLIAYQDFSPANRPTPSDEFGHGTHVAGTIAGSATSGLAIGAAPKASLIVGRIFDRGGDSTREGILLAMQWIADPDGDPLTSDHAQVVNSSWGDSDPYDQRESKDEPFCQIIDSWISLGIVPVFSAGNSGPRAGTIGLPGGCPGAISVGASEINDRLMYFSSTGPAKWKSTSLVKPEFVAPGFNIKSAEAGGGYEEMSGTSMAAPHVTGAVALLLQANPLMSVQDVLDALVKGAKELGVAGKDDDFGWGRVDVMKSL